MMFPVTPSEHRFSPSEIQALRKGQVLARVRSGERIDFQDGHTPYGAAIQQHDLLTALRWWIKLCAEALWLQQEEGGMETVTTGLRHE